MSILTKKTHLSSSFNYWAMDFQCWWTFEQKIVENTGDFLISFLRSLKLFYIDKCLYIAVETFANNNLISYLERKFTAVWHKFRKCTILCILPHYFFWMFDSPDTDYISNYGATIWFLWKHVFIYLFIFCPPPNCLLLISSGKKGCFMLFLWLT